MALDANSYGSVAGVAALVKHLCNSAGTFDDTTAPTLAEVEAFIDQGSDTLNGWLARARYVIPVTQTDAVQVLARYANYYGAGMAELSQRSAGYAADDPNRRENKFFALFDRAEAYIESGALAQLGATVSAAGLPPPFSGLRVGGQTASNQLLRPIFSRTMFGNQPNAEYPGPEPTYDE